MEPLLWSIKYIPKSWDDFIGQNAAIDQLRSYAKSSTIPHLLLYGPNGTGKTIAAHLFARYALGDAFGSNFKSLNIRDIRSYSMTDAKRNLSAIAKIDRKDRTELDEYMSLVYREAKAALKVKGRSRDPNRSQLLQQAIKMFASTYTVTNEMVKILVLDEADALDNNMIQALRRTMEQYSDACRFILITPSLAGWNPAIISRCVVVNFPALRDEDVRMLLNTVAEMESVDLDINGCNAIIKIAEGNMRRALNLLQICASTGKPVMEDLVYRFSDTPLTSGVRKMVSHALKNEYPQARKILRNLLTSEQYSPNEVIIEIQKDLAKRPFDDECMRKLTDRIAEIDYRMVEGKNSHIHLTALLASIGNIVNGSTQ